MRYSTYLGNSAVLLGGYLLLCDSSGLHGLHSGLDRRLVSLGLGRALDRRRGVNGLEDARARVASGGPCTFARHLGRDFERIGQSKLVVRLEYNVVSRLRSRNMLCDTRCRRETECDTQEVHTRASGLHTTGIATGLSVCFWKTLQRRKFGKRGLLRDSGNSAFIY